MSKPVRLQNQIILYYGTLLLLALTLSGVLYQSLNERLSRDRIEALLLQTLHAMEQGLGALLDNTNKASQRIIASPVVQQVLKSDLSSEGIAGSNQEIQKVINDVLLAEQTVASVYLFRNDDIYYAWDTYRLGLATVRVQEAPWHQQVLDEDGGQYWVTDGGGILNRKSNTAPYLTLLRTVNELFSAEKIGLLMVNVPVGEVRKIFQSATGVNVVDFELSWEGRKLISFTDPAIADYGASHQPDLEHPVNTALIGGGRFLLASGEWSKWTLRIALPDNTWANPYESINQILIPLAIAFAAVIFLGSLWISRFITDPLLSLLESMKRSEAGDYALVSLSGRSEEILQLQDRYNSMIRTIEQSIAHEQEEQRQRRRMELEILHEQIKPHFLYNALESAGYLSITGEKEKAYRLITTLANFYRSSLSKGNEVIRLDQEFQVTRDYLTIEGMRYPGAFEVNFQREPEVDDALIPKLTLQPLVENSLHHGVIPTGQPGRIDVLASREGSFVVLSIEDDGKGMSSDHLALLTEGGSEVHSRSFGLRGTMARLKLYYGDAFSYTLVSSPGEGMSLKIRFPIQREVRNA